MEVTCGAEWPTSGGGRRSYALTLDKDDLIEQMGQEAVGELSNQQILKQLNTRAEILVVAHVAEEGGMDKEFAQRRIKELKNA
jgi:hypothetical protein